MGIARGDATLSSSPASHQAGPSSTCRSMFALQAHPECVYNWARIIVDLSSTQDAVIADMSPRDVTDVPLEVETTLESTFRFRC